MTDSDSRLLSLFDTISEQSLPPVQAWQPCVTRSIAMHIAKNGDWYYQDSLIKRPRMVKLFSTVLRVDDDGLTYLVTPQERLRITVEDAPFTAVLLEPFDVPDAQTLVLTTNVGDKVIVDEQHPIWVNYDKPGGEPSPYVLVRDRLKALITRAVYYELAELAQERDEMIGVESRGFFMRLSEP